MNRKILVGVPRKDHILLAFDEIEGLNQLGYHCIPFKYIRSDQTISVAQKMLAVLIDNIKLLFLLYKHRPAFLYLNSRFDPLACLRDAFVVAIVKILYLYKIKVIIKTHGSNPDILYKDSFIYRKLVVPVLQKKVDAWFFLSEEEKKLIAQKNQRLAEKIHITANIVKPERSVKSVEFRKKHGMDTGKFNVLFVSRMRKEKGPFEVMRAIPLIKHKEDCLFTFVGDGPDFDDLKQLSVELDVLPFVQFTGFIADEECNHFYANADLLVFPTYFDEGFPMVLFKSIAAGLPVITTRTRAAIDHLKEGEHVLWVEAKNHKQVATAIHKILHDENLRKVMASNNQTIGANFTQEAICRDMDRVFQTLV